MSTYAENKYAGQTINQLNKKIEALYKEIKSLEEQKEIWKEIYIQSEIDCINEYREEEHK